MYVYNQISIKQSLRIKLIKNYKSHSIRVISGVSQGSILGPIAFCIYVNDVSDIIIGNTACKHFTDDTKLYSCVETGGSSSDLDASLNNLISWATKWQLKLI